MSKTATMSIIFQAQSLNYGEGTSNISELKKLTRGNGQQFTVASRQCLRYDIARLGGALFGWNLQVVDKSKGTVQFKDELSIKDSEEMDLFGYMKTKEGEGGKNRSAAVRISFATSLEAYKNDIEFLSNKGLADRINENANLANIEQHLSYYTYTITMDLDKVGVDGEVRLDNETRYKRISQFLDVVKILNREIRGRLENLSPLFVIGGVYDFPNPLFLGRIKLLGAKDSFAIDLEPIKSAMEVSVLDCKVEEKTFVGIVSGLFANEDEIKDLFKDKTLSVNQFFENMKKQIKTYYGV
ncbi:type I-B CRISPR-associated protein Cas7/Cst2/DevR [Caloramator australicus]|uniref:CRISPR-associated negative autoregulator n=1 Tax=Caloramator australicus RC3 TaxID=857293 RepID=I7KX20_9CLOT|nr:type I-B CRISPR-associated protein Cas7/Cst2/DevR [Caloramator australicus]CCJ34806.1 CRISPR-associated negative autoregulator [Caloramator australicus RC3]